MVLGVLSLGGLPAGRVPRFVFQSLHRNAALLAFVMLGAHIVSCVVDAVRRHPLVAGVRAVGATYEPLWLGLGAVAVDLLLVIAVTSLMRRRLADRTWRLLHQLAWPMWGLSLAHGIGMGTDLRDAWWLVTLGCGVAVAAALVWRLVRLVRERLAGHRPQPEPRTPAPVRPRAEGAPMTHLDLVDCPPSPVPFPDHVDVDPGPALLAGIERGPSLAAHRKQYGEPPNVSPEELHEALRRIALRGRGGAGFPFATKLDAVLQQRVASGAGRQHE